MGVKTPQCKKFEAPDSLAGRPGTADYIPQGLAYLSAGLKSNNQGHWSHSLASSILDCFYLESQGKHLSQADLRE